MWIETPRDKKQALQEAFSSNSGDGMPTRILEKERLIPGKTSKLVLDAPHIAQKAAPGHFVMLRVSERGERIPLTIADCDPHGGSVTIVYLVLGKSTAMLEELGAGDDIADLCGPLGKPTHIEKTDGTVVCVGGGTGIAAMHHIAKGHHRAGNRVTAVIGARSRDLLLFEKELSSFCDEMLVTTDDGSYGIKGLVTEPLRGRLREGGVSEVVAVGPVPMMAAVVETARPFDAEITVSLNSIMVDGIGMCGACRVSVGGQTRFTCVDGPEFDGRLVDFGELRRRLGAFTEQEKLSFDAYRCSCHDSTRKN
jgi:ferredoxin--NADP+ reductase